GCSPGHPARHARPDVAAGRRPRPRDAARAARADHVAARVGPRAHRGLRGPVVRPPAGGRAAPARGPGGGLRRVRDAARRAGRGRAARPRRGRRVPGARPVAHAERAGRSRAERPARARPAPRAPAHRDHAPGALPRRAQRRLPVGDAVLRRRARLPRDPRRRVPHGRRRRRLRLRQRASAARGRGPVLPHHTHPHHQRDVPLLRRRRRLRAARVVERRGVVVEGGVRHHAPSRLDGCRRASRPARLVVRGRRLRAKPRGPAPHRGGVGEGGDLEPRDGSRRSRTGVGVDVDRVRRLPRLLGVPVPRVQPGVLPPQPPRAARRIVGCLAARCHAHLPQLGSAAAAADLQWPATRQGDLM
ncbi:MAG: protein of unknown function DUF323, partial [uncultured Solirubrobacteraceae bacterium]